MSTANQSDSAARAEAVERLQQYLKDIERIPATGRVARCRSRRYPYGTTQWIAPYSGDAPPDRPEFHEVRCGNLSTSGLSFFWPQPPDYQHVIIRLGTVDGAIHVTARVVRSQPVDGEAGPAYLVGCQFTGRIEL